MRIVHYHSGIRLSQGGVVRAVLDLSAALAAAGHEVLLATPDDSDVPAAWRADDPGLPRVVRTPSPSAWPGRPGAAFTTALGPRLDEADILHLHGMWVPANVSLGRMAAARGLPFILSPHGMLDDWSLSIKPAKKVLFMRLHGRRMLRKAAFVHCCAGGELAQAGPRLPRENGVVVPLLMDLSDFRELPSARAAAGESSDRPCRVGFLSRLHPVKGLEILMDAVGQLAERRPDLELHVAGSGDAAYERSLHERAQRLGLGDRCRFLGFTAGRDKVAFLAGLDLFVVPTLHENFGFVLLESLAAGTPVLTTEHANTGADVLAARAGRTADRTPEAMAAAMDAMLADCEGLRAMGERGRRWVLEAFGDGAGIAGFEDLYASAGGTVAGPG